MQFRLDCIVNNVPGSQRTDRVSLGSTGEAVDNRRKTKSPRFISFTIVAALTITALLTITIIPPEGSSSLPAATYLHGWLHLDIPYRAPSAGAGRLILKVLNPDDQVLGHTERQLSGSAGPGRWKDKFRANHPTSPLPCR